MRGNSSHILSQKIRKGGIQKREIINNIFLRPDPIYYNRQNK
jgi:hypothetical protein